MRHRAYADTAIESFLNEIFLKRKCLEETDPERIRLEKVCIGGIRAIVIALCGAAIQDGPSVEELGISKFSKELTEEIHLKGETVKKLSAFLLSEQKTSRVLETIKAWCDYARVSCEISENISDEDALKKLAEGRYLRSLQQSTAQMIHHQLRSSRVKNPPWTSDASTKFSNITSV